MGLIEAIFQGWKEAKSDKKSDWAYNQLEVTPFLHSPEELRNLYNQADKEQKGSILYHIERFNEPSEEDPISRMDRPHMKEYKTLANQIWDDLR